MLRRLLAKLTVLALSTAPAAAANPPSPFGEVTTIVHEDTAALIGRSLALTLSELPPLEATHMATGWALSPERVRRAAVAQALEWTFPLVPDAQIIEHLSRDPDPRIRASVARAAWARRVTGGDLRVLARLSDDPDPEVRAIAARAR
jgi:hypothetical protein